mmetsp:Transcript_54777/g.123835  ORF Transcript_54777/g.123835 Transcript_54777/m.123835 type:complete len:622 (-) Transcript_54777:48-1913(-)
MAAAMAGLLSKKFMDCGAFPEKSGYCQTMSEHLRRRPFKIRFAEISDLDQLERLEEAWDRHLRAPREVLLRRLQTSPSTNLVCELNGRVVGVLYMQKISSLDDIDSEEFQQISDAHSPTGSIVQLIAIVVDPEVKMNLGSELLAFARHLASVNPDVESVVAVTRCRGYRNYRGTMTMQQYINEHVAGSLTDPIVNFHTSHGAEVVRLVPGFRLEDLDNNGAGVLIRYNLNELREKAQKKVVGSETPQTTGHDIPEKAFDKGQVAAQLEGPQSKTTQAMNGKAENVGTIAKAAAASLVPSLDLIANAMDKTGYPMDTDDLLRGFFSYGMDSLELVMVRSKLSEMLDMELPAPTLLNYPNPLELADHLDKMRGVGEVNSVDSSANVAEEQTMQEGEGRGPSASASEEQSRQEGQDRGKAIYNTRHGGFSSRIRNLGLGPEVADGFRFLERMTEDEPADMAEAMLQMPEDMWPAGAKGQSKQEVTDAIARRVLRVRLAVHRAKEYQKGELAEGRPGPEVNAEMQGVLNEICLENYGSPLIELLQQEEEEQRLAEKEAKEERARRQELLQAAAKKRLQHRAPHRQLKQNAYPQCKDPYRGLGSGVCWPKPYPLSVFRPRQRSAAP